VPDQDPSQVVKQLQDFLQADAPWGVEVKVTQHGAGGTWWMTDPNGPAFEAAMGALRQGFDRDPVAIGCGGSIGFVGPLAKLFDDAPALLIGIEDPASNAHAPNESLHEGDFKKLMNSLVRLFHNLGQLKAGEVK
jgi:acetylornithine deacetylase/succinyl-diaminopimelate desuccinylase-like protein